MLPIGSYPLRQSQTRLRQAKSSELRCHSAGFYTRVAGDQIHSALKFVELIPCWSILLGRELAFPEQSVHSLEVLVVLVARPFERDGFVVRQCGAGL